MPAPLTDAQRRLLTAASQRPDRLLLRPDHLRGGATTKIASALLQHGLVREVVTDPNGPVWRMDEARRTIGLRLTPSGFAVLGLVAPSLDPPDGVSPSSPRAGTKAARVLSLLARPAGATPAELAAATGWLPHTVRAALTGLRRRGYALVRARDAAGRRTYRLATAVEA